jgi:hypothetical protein
MSEGNDDPGAPIDEAPTDPVDPAPKSVGWAQAAIPGLGAGKAKPAGKESSTGDGADTGPSLGGRLLAKSRSPVVAGVIIVAVIVGILLALSISDNSHSANTASDVEYTVLNQVQGTAKGQFHDPSIVTMSCDTPSVWKDGDVFTCKGYKANSTQVAGVYRATVAIQGGNHVSWSGTWTPTS